MVRESPIIGEAVTQLFLRPSKRNENKGWPRCGWYSNLYSYMWLAVYTWSLADDVEVGVVVEEREVKEELPSVISKQDDWQFWHHLLHTYSWLTANSPQSTFAKVPWICVKYFLPIYLTNFSNNVSQKRLISINGLNRTCNRPIMEVSI